MKMTEKVFEISKTIKIKLPGGKPTKDWTKTKSEIKR